MIPDVNPTDSVRTSTPDQVQGQGQTQQQNVIVNVHTGETAPAKSQPAKNPPKTRKPGPNNIHTQAKQEATKIRHTSTQNVGSNNTAFGGDNITVNGAGNTVTGRIENSTAAVGHGNEVSQVTIPQQEETTPPPEPDEPDKPTIPREDQLAGKTLALRLHAETNSRFANNGNIANVFGAVNNRNAYSFFKEYDNLANTADNNPKTTGAMHDSYDVWDTFNNINVKITTPAVDALLEQAAELEGISESDEFNTLETLNSLAKQKQNGITAQIKTPDLSNNEAVGMDQAIKALVNRMSQEYR